HRRSAAAHRDAAHHEDPQFAARQSAGAICPPYSHRRRGFARSPGFPNPQRRRAQSAPAAPSPGPSSDGSPAPPTRPALPPSERLQPPAFPSIMSPNEQDYDPINFAIRTLDLSDTERAALVALLSATIAADRYPLSARVRALKRILDKLEPPAP